MSCHTQGRSVDYEEFMAQEWLHRDNAEAERALYTYAAAGLAGTTVASERAHLPHRQSPPVSPQVRMRTRLPSPSPQTSVLEFPWNVWREGLLGLGATSTSQKLTYPLTYGPYLRSLLTYALSLLAGCQVGIMPYSERIGVSGGFPQSAGTSGTAVALAGRQAIRVTVLLHCTVLYCYCTVL